MNSSMMNDEVASEVSIAMIRFYAVQGADKELTVSGMSIMGFC